MASKKSVQKENTGGDAISKFIVSVLVLHDMTNFDSIRAELLNHLQNKKGHNCNLKGLSIAFSKNIFYTKTVQICEYIEINDIMLNYW